MLASCCKIREPARIVKHFAAFYILAFKMPGSCIRRPRPCTDSAISQCGPNRPDWKYQPESRPRIQVGIDKDRAFLWSPFGRSAGVQSTAESVLCAHDGWTQ